jgi:hypothetical protein
MAARVRAHRRHPDVEDYRPPNNPETLYELSELQDLAEDKLDELAESEEASSRVKRTVKKIYETQAQLGDVLFDLQSERVFNERPRKAEIMRLEAIELAARQLKFYAKIRQELPQITFPRHRGNLKKILNQLEHIGYEMAYDEMEFVGEPLRD